MYNNEYKNIKITYKKDIGTFLKLIAKANIDLNLFAMGGTAMLLSGIKESTKDIDFMTTNSYGTIKEIFDKVGLTEKSTSKLCNIWYLDDIRIDIFYDAFILGTTLPDDWNKMSRYIKEIGKIKLSILNWYDIIITKLSRSEKRDIDDILMILKKENIDFKKLKKRYYEVSEVSLNAHYDLKFKHLEHMMNKK